MKDNYKNFSELTEYAAWRFQKSIKRNDPVAAKYWLAVREWAEERILSENIHDISPYISYRALLGIFQMVCKKDFNMTVRIYWQLKHVRKMLINNGQKVPRLSLDWLRDWGEGFYKEPSVEVTENDTDTARGNQKNKMPALRSGD